MDAEDKNINPHLISLVMMLASAAWQQLGKVPNPITGKIDKEVENAQITIDILSMLKDKMRGNLSAEEAKLLGNTVSDLQLNYADEVSKEKKEEVKPN